MRIVCDFFVEKCTIMCIVCNLMNRSRIEFAVVVSTHLPKANNFILKFLF